MSGWPMVRFGEVADFVSGGTPNRKIKNFYTGEIPWISGADISDSGDIEIRRKITEEAVNKSATNIVPAGTLLLVTRTSVGKVATAPIDLAFSQDITGIFPKKGKIIPEYLEHFIRAIGSLELERKARGVTIKGVSRSDVTTLLIPLPPLREQKRIAEILGKINDSMKKLKNQIYSIESLPKKIFEQNFNREFRDGKRPSVPASDFVFNTQYGTSKKASNSGSIPILRMGNITYSGQVDMSNLKYIDLKDQEIDKFTLQDGDILFNRTNSAELVGKTAVFQADLSQIISYAGYLIRVRTNATSNPYYIAGYLNSPSGKAQLRLRAKAIVGMANINAKEFLSLRIPSANKTEQDNFAMFYLHCESTRKLFIQKLTLLQELQRSLSARAFAGLL